MNMNHFMFYMWLVQHTSIVYVIGFAVGTLLFFGILDLIDWMKRRQTK